MSNKNLISIKSFRFALRVTTLYRSLKRSDQRLHICKQFFRSASSIGANVIEAEHAQSKKDFVHKMNIALKEANDSRYWLELLYHSKYLQKDSFDVLFAENTTLIKILASIVKTTKSKYL